MYGNISFEKVFDIKNILALHLQARENKVQNKNYANIERKCITGLYPIVSNLIQSESDLTFDPMKLDLDRIFKSDY